MTVTCIGGLATGSEFDLAPGNNVFEVVETRTSHLRQTYKVTGKTRNGIRIAIPASPVSRVSDSTYTAPQGQHHDR